MTQEEREDEIRGNSYETGWRDGYEQAFEHMLFAAFDEIADLKRELVRRVPVPDDSTEKVQ